MTDFTGFTPETIDFLWELRMNNNKAWMEENRERYRTVLKEPFDALSAALTKKFWKRKTYPRWTFPFPVSIGMCVFPRIKALIRQENGWC